MTPNQLTALVECGEVLPSREAAARSFSRTTNVARLALKYGIKPIAFVSNAHSDKYGVRRGYYWRVGDLDRLRERVSKARSAANARNGSVPWRKRQKRRTLRQMREVGEALRAYYRLPREERKKGVWTRLLFEDAPV